METIERLAIEADCTRLMNEFSWCTDTFEYDKALSLFVPDCTLQRADEVFEGIDGLRSIMERRAPDRRTCHVVSGIVIDIIDDNHASGKANALVFGYRGAKPGEEVPLDTADSIVRFEGEFRRTDDGWKIAKWTIGMNFRKAAP